jgi:hypothetical protein
MSCPSILPSWTCWWPWPRATSGARSATRSWWTWSVPRACGQQGQGSGLGRKSAIARAGWAGDLPHWGGLWGRPRTPGEQGCCGSETIAHLRPLFPSPHTLRSAASAPAASSGPLLTDSGHCPGTGRWMSRAWVSTSGLCATWPMRSCPVRWTAAGISTGTAAAHPLCSWPLSPLPRWACPPAVLGASRVHGFDQP